MCRMCLVEVEGPRGSALQVSCMLDAAEGMVVHTASPLVKKAQDGVLEFLLINHPLDCPVCDKGGECPLQDQTMAYGPGESRFVEEKRHFEKPIPISDLVFLDRERCILCDRCTRFASEVAGDPLISFTGRGNETQVLTFPDEPFASYFSRQHRADLPGRRAHREAVPIQGPAVGPRAGRVDLHHVRGRMPGHGAVVAGPGAAVPGRRHRSGQLGLAVRQGPLRLRGDRARGTPRRHRCSATATPWSRHRGRPRSIGRRLRSARRSSRVGPTSVAVIGGARLTNEDATRGRSSRRRSSAPTTSTHSSATGSIRSSSSGFRPRPSTRRVRPTRCSCSPPT